MGSTKFKNIVKLKKDINPIQEKDKIYGEVLENNTPLPKTLTYKDIDIAFRDWVKEDLEIEFENKRIPTIALFSSQRFSEYMQTWQDNDNQKNINMNFKVVTRENNPQQGTMQNKNMNIPGDRTYLINRVRTEDENGRPYYLDYRMKQPFCVDLIYTVSIVTNKYELLNEFNMLINDKFKAIQCYITPNGHKIPMKLEGITDESEYSMDDRQFFSQSYQIRVMAYIIKKKDFIVEECPVLKLYFDDNKDDDSSVEIEENEDNSVVLTIMFNKNTTSTEFTMNTTISVDEIMLSNVKKVYKTKINDTVSVISKDSVLNEEDRVKFYGVVTFNKDEIGKITINAHKVQN